MINEAHPRGMSRWASGAVVPRSTARLEAVRNKCFGAAQSPTERSAGGRVSLWSSGDDPRVWTRLPGPCTRVTRVGAPPLFKLHRRRRARVIPMGSPAAADLSARTGELRCFLIRLIVKTLYGVAMFMRACLSTLDGGEVCSDIDLLPPSRFSLFLQRAISGVVSLFLELDAVSAMIFV